MATRAGAIGNLPWVRGTSFPGVKMAPRGAQHKEAINAELQIQMQKLGIKNFIETYGSSTFQSIAPAVTGGIIGYEASKFIPEIHGGKGPIKAPPPLITPIPSKEEMYPEPLITPIPPPKKDKPEGLPIPTEEKKVPEGFPIPKQKTWKDYILTKDKLEDKKPEFGKLTKAETQTAKALKEDKPDYYSRVARAVEGSQDIATADQWLGVIQGQGATKAELDYLGLTELLKGDKKITKADLLSQIKEKDLSSRITTTLIPKKDMGVIIYPEYDLGGHGASNDTRVYVMQYDVTKDTEGKYLPHDEPIEYRAPAVHIGKEQYGRNTFGTLRVQVGYEGIKELEDLFILNEGQSDLVQQIQKLGTVKDWHVLKGSEITPEFIKENFGDFYNLKIEKYQTQKDLLEKTGLSTNKVLYATDTTTGIRDVVRRIDENLYYVFNKKGLTPESKSVAFRDKETAMEHAKFYALPDFPIKDSRKIAELMVNEFITQAILSGADSIGFANGAILRDRYTGQDPDKAESLAFWQDKMLISSAEKILKRWIKKSGWNEPLESLITEYDIETGADLQKRDILPTMDEMRTEDYFLETVTAKDLFDYIVKNQDPLYLLGEGQEIPDFISLLDEEGLGVAGNQVKGKLEAYIDSGHSNIEFMVYQNEAGNFNFRLPIVNKSAAEFYYKDTELGLPEWAKKKFEKDKYQRTEAIYSKYVENYKTETSHGRHKIIKMKFPKSLQEQFISESQKFTKLDKQKLPVEDQTDRLFA